MSYPPQQPGPYGPQGYPPPGPGAPRPQQGFPGQPQGYPGQQGFPPGQQGMPPGGQPPPPGQQPQWGPPPAPGQQPGMPPAPAPKKKSGVGRVLISLAVGIVGVIVVAVIRVAAGGAGTASVGDCIDITNPSMSSPDYKSAQCGTPESDFKVAKSLSGSSQCPGHDAYSEITETRRRGSGTRLCLELDVKPGDCVKTQVVGLETKVPCGPGASVKVTAVDPSTRGEALCGQGDTAVVYPEPALTVCLTKA